MSSNRTSSAAADLARPARLVQALARAFGDVDERRAFVGVRFGDERASAFVAEDGAAGSDVPRERMPVGCLAKILTATLACRILAKARIGVDTRLVDLVDVGRSRAVLERVTLRHLLDHTHGLDDSLMSSPTLSDGFVDVIDLSRRASTARPLAEPGVAYSYGSVGAWLVAAVLERLTGRPYTNVLADELLAPAGIRVAQICGRVCPATGGALSLTIADWLRLLRVGAANPALLEAADRLPSPIMPLPGWNPLERGILLGWKYHGGGWFGHQSVWPRSSAWVRVNPQRDVELVLLSRDHAASVVAARVFGDTLPELFDLRMPVPCAPAVADSSACVGRYASARLCAEISLSAGGLVLCVDDCLRGTRQCAALAPAAARTLFVRSPAIESFPYIQLVGVHGSGVTHLWNGRFMLRRL